MSTMVRLRRLILLRLLVVAIGGLGAAAQAQSPQAGGATGHATGLLPDDPAKIDRVAPAPLFRAFLPRRVDLAAYLPPVGDQGQQGSCAAWATSYAGMSLAYNDAVAKTHLAVGRPKVIAFSPAYTYNLLHRGRCGGTSLIDALDGVRSSGLLPLTQFPYSPSDCSAIPDPAQQEAALQSRLIHYRKIDAGQRDGLDRIRGALQMHHPVVFGLFVGNEQSAFQRYAGGVYDGEGGGIGAHAMLLIGYDDDAQTFRIVNSWGPEWGEHGYMTLTYRAFISGLIDPVVYEIDQIDTNGIAGLVASADDDRRDDAVVAIDNNPVPPPKPPPDIPPKKVPDAVDVDAVLRKVETLSQVTDCGRLSHVERDGVLRLSGFVPDIASLKAELAKAQVPSERVAFDQVAELPWPQCEIRLDYVERPLGSERGWRLNLTPRPELGPVEEGQSLKLTISNPHSGKFFPYVYYIQAFRDGNVVPLLQPLIGRGGQPVPSAFGPRIDLTDPVAGIQRELRVTAPVGAEAVILIASRNPLFPGELAAGQLNERQLLTALRAGVAKADRAGDLLGVDVAFINTRLATPSSGALP